MDNEEQEVKRCEIDTREIDLAKQMIKRYWTSTRQEQYVLLSNRYKKLLKQAYKINNAFDYSQGFPRTERVWAKQTYEKETVYANRRIEFIVLAQWLEEGYEGVMTFNFDMVKENGTWKIDYIMH